MFQSNNHIWNAAVTRNIAALKVIVAQLLSLLATYGGSDAAKIPRVIHKTILRALQPAESALRRLIVIAARDTSIPVLQSNPANKMSEIRTARKRTSGLRVAFQLIDPRKRFGRQRISYTSQNPRVFFIAPAPPFSPLAQHQDQAAFHDFKQPEPETDIGARRLHRRLQAITTALEDIPRQIKRLVRLTARREQRNVFIPPLRPGRPPGHRKIPQLGIDVILNECHRFAQAVLSEPRTDTS